MFIRRFLIHEFVLLALLAAGAVAQETGLENIPLSASESRFLVVPGGNPDVRTAFNLETPSLGQGSFLLTSTDPASVISLIAPDGREITAQNASSNGYGFGVISPGGSGSILFSPLYPSLFNVRITLPLGAGGQIQVKVNNSRVPTDSAVLATYYPASSVRVALTSNKPVFGPGETAILSLLVFNGTVPVSSAESILRIQSSSDVNATVYSTVCNDSGSFDAAAGDGIYACAIDGLPAGDYIATARITAPGGIARTTSTSLRVVQPRGNIVGSTDNGIDRNGNGLIEGIRLEVSLNILVAGNYRLITRLRGSNGTAVQQGMDAILTQGPKALSVDFPARLVSSLGVNGPYTIENCTLLFEGPERDDLAAARQDLGRTKPYILSSLELGGPLPPSDLNRDGLVDCLDIGMVRASFGKTAGQPGFNVKADLNGDRVVDVRDLAMVSRQLTAGTHCGN